MRGCPHPASAGILAALVTHARNRLAWKRLSGDPIMGKVSDPQQAVVPGVTMTARRPDTGLVRTAVSDADGFSRFLALPPGEYEVTAEVSGFRAARRTGIRLSVGTEAEDSNVEATFDLPPANSPFSEP